MKIIFAIVIVIAVLMLGSWTAPTPSSSPTLVTGNSKFAVYKFYDNGEYHYVAVGADQNIAVSIR